MLDDELGFMPEEEKIRELVYDEPFAPNTVLVPVHCGTCKLLMYTAEKNVGKWMVCPDCNRQNEVHAVPPSDTIIVEFSEDGAMKIRKVDDEPPRPVMRIISDYRTVPGAVDEGAERLPNITIGEEVLDPLERAFDKILDTKKRTTSTTASVETPTQSRRTSAITPVSDSTQHPKKTEEIQTVPIPQLRIAVPGTLPPKDPSANRLPLQQDTNNQRSSFSEAAPASLRSGKTKVPDGNPWPAKHFFYPFFDTRNRIRFQIDRYSGMVTLFMTMNLFRLLGQFLFSADPRGPDYVYGLHDILFFYGEYLLAFAPLAVWFVFVMLNGMTLFVETREGKNNIKNWMKIRAEFAFHYLGWILLILFLSPFPGIILFASLGFGGVESYWRLLLPIFSSFLLYPILFLNLSMGETGFELFLKKVWISPLKRPGKWLIYYLTAFLMGILMAAAFIGGFATIFYFIRRSFWLAQLPFALTSVLLCFIFDWVTYLYFRILGGLAWCIDQDSE